MLRTSFSALALAVAPLALAGLGGTAIARPVYTGVDGGKVAVSGYDAVSYFSGTPVLGKAEFTVTYDNADYHFANAENAAKFKADPAAYAPQFGGHCSWAMSRGYLAPGDPTQYKIVNNRLYINFNKEVHENWLKDIPGNISKADANWVKVPDDAKFGG